MIPKIQVGYHAQEVDQPWRAKKLSKAQAASCCDCSWTNPAHSQLGWVHFVTQNWKFNPWQIGKKVQACAKTSRTPSAELMAVVMAWQATRVAR